MVTVSGGTKTSSGRGSTPDTVKEIPLTIRIIDKKEMSKLINSALKAGPNDQGEYTVKTIGNRPTFVLKEAWKLLAQFRAAMDGNGHPTQSQS